MRDQLEKQLLRLRAIILPSHLKREHSHWRIADSINLIRGQVIKEVRDEERDIWDRLTPIIDFKQPELGNNPYTVSAEDTLRLCDQLLSIIEQSVIRPQESLLSRVVPITRSIFLIHGHDTTNTLRLRVLLQKQFKVDPIILSEKPGRGRVLLEKFEEEAGVCSFAFALLTPDDLVAPEKEPYRQARPNVLFELGWFYGRLGRSNVCILHQSGTSIPSDLAGIARIAFRNSVDEALGEIERELQAARIIGQKETDSF